jgi:hypothetical protein
VSSGGVTWAVSRVATGGAHAELASCPLSRIAAISARAGGRVRDRAEPGRMAAPEASLTRVSASR